MWPVMGGGALRGALRKMPMVKRGPTGAILFPLAFAPASARAPVDNAPQPAGFSSRIGSLEVRLARGKREIHKAQRLRYKVFFEEGGAIPDRKSALTRRDVDPFDHVCDHLVVIDHAGVNRFGRSKARVVGTYRLLRQEMAARVGGFYSAHEYDIAPLLARHGGKRFLELGRSCVLAEYRGKRTLELLWRGIKAYLEHHRVDVMFGCASFEGTDPQALALPLSFLHHHATDRADWQVAARPDRYQDMALLDASAINMRRAVAALPPLIKGYLRLGARFGEGAVVDRQFGTTDVFVVMPVAELDARWLAHFGGPTVEGREAA